MTDLGALRRALADAVGAADAAQLADLIGALEAAKARVIARLVSPPPAAEQSTESMTAPELAAVLNVPPSWLYECARNGRIPARRLGRYVRFDRAAVERALADNSKISSLGSGKTVRKKRANGSLQPVQPMLPRPLPREGEEQP